MNLEMTPLYNLVGLMFLYIVLPVIIGAFIFRRLPRQLFQLVLMLITIGGAVAWIKFVLLNASVYQW